MEPVRVSIQENDFDLSAEVDRLRAGLSGAGAVVAFVGTVRDLSEGLGVARLELEHYPGMTERAIESMIDEVHRRFEVLGARVVHRIGVLEPSDRIVLAAVAAAHRGEAFQACEFLMDYLKTQAPFWKKEYTPQGPRWVEAKARDDEALRRWGLDLGNAEGGPHAGEEG